MTRQQRTPVAAPVPRRERRRLEREERASRPRPGRATRSWWQSPMVLASAAALAMAAIAIGIAIATARPAPPPPTTSLTTPPSWLQPGLADGQALGRADAPVVLEVVSDYQCPICGRFAREYLSRLVTDFVAPGQLRIVDRPIAFLGTGEPDESLDAAVAATCAARQGRYWDFHDYLMWNQEGENRGAFGRERLTAMAGAAGLDTASQATCFSDPTVADAIRSETSRAFGQGIQSTPTFILDGQQIVGLVPYEQLAVAIGAALQ